MRTFLYALVFLASSSHICFGWWDTPHMVIAEIAKRELSDTAREKAEEIIAYFNNDFPESSTFVTAACFADDVTKIGLSGFKVWHGLLIPYDPDGLMTERELASITALTSANNLCTGLAQCIHTLQDPKASIWAQSFMLRTLLHLVGDIHQPLHCILYYSHDFPTGDLAGHNFIIDHPKFATLHKLWDSVFDMGPKRYPRPLALSDQKQIEAMASDITEAFPKESLPESAILCPYVWGEEGYQIAIEDVYDGLILGEAPSDAYLAHGEWVARRQIAKAGYRLANLLEKLLG